MENLNSLQQKGACQKRHKSNFSLIGN